MRPPPDHRFGHYGDTRTARHHAADEVQSTHAGSQSHAPTSPPCVRDQMLLQGAIAAASKVGLLLNVHRDDLQAVLGVLPALKKPTISALSDPDWVAINTIVEEAVVRQILPKLKAAKAQGIVEYPLNKIVL